MFSIHQYQTFYAGLNLLTRMFESRKPEVENVWISFCVYLFLVYCFLFTGLTVLKEQPVSEVWKHMELQIKAKSLRSINLSEL